MMAHWKYLRVIYPAHCRVKINWSLEIHIEGVGVLFAKFVPLVIAGTLDGVHAFGLNVRSQLLRSSSNIKR